MNIPILYEDTDVCVIDKPSGLVVNKSESTKGETVQEWFINKYSIFNVQCSMTSEFARKGGVLHRLDKDASGVLVLAKNESSYEYLKQQFLLRQAEKTYLVLVHGRMRENEGVLSTPIERNPNKKTHFYVGRDLSKTAVTFWKTLSGSDKFTFLEVKIMTGRTHQIRVHMKHLGHPIVADPIYGFSKSWREDLKFCPRLFLHANRLRINLPSSKDPSEFVSQLPEELKQVLASELNFHGV